MEVEVGGSFFLRMPTLLLLAPRFLSPAAGGRRVKGRAPLTHG